MMEMDSSQESLSYYNVLGVSMDSSDGQIRRAYRKLAVVFVLSVGYWVKVSNWSMWCVAWYQRSKQWHPDKWAKYPSFLGKAKHKFQQIQEAYSVLSDQKKRSMYDVGLYDPQDEVDEGFADFLQEMSSLMENVKKEEKKYSFGEIQDMFWEMARSFNWSDSFGFDDNVGYEEPLWSQEMFGLDDYTRSPKRVRANTYPLPQFHDPGISRRETKCV